MKSLICLSLILLPLFSVVEGQLPPRCPDTDEAVALAKFAISEHNWQSNANLVYVNVVQETMQLVTDISYRLIISAKIGSHAAKNYEAVVFRNIDDSKILLSFEECRFVNYVKRSRMYVEYVCIRYL
ncbi:hypothetical protein Bca52824_014655 [Brassica carinata]|uniref:Cystatin domain-containing protein n=1 Tax=Brassica carinata TaxID=52824 RepID=A0A8X8B4M8_BRACI|nr:hypothetical protein Bca52824_014655 [Brassica carinata]